MNKAWEKGKHTSLSFYRSKMHVKAKEFNREFPLPSYFGPMIGDKRSVVIADIGAGMFSTTGSTWPGTDVYVIPCDLLADEFNAMLEEAGIKPLIPVEREDMEHLSYGDSAFDIVHCANALDHTVNPIQAIKEMYRVCKPGGWIYLRHFSHVGVHQNYNGLHQWNIDLEGADDCKIWNRENVYVLSALFSSFHTELKQELPYDAKDMVVSKMQKKL
jgi:SAM-dependent methyltransferase